MNRKPKKGDIVFVKGIPELAGKEVKVVASAFGSVWVKPKKGAREDIEVSIDCIEFAEPEKLSTKQKYEIIERLVLPEFLYGLENKKNQLYFLNRLFFKYQNINFWTNFDPGFKVKSMIWWLAGGKDDIRKYYNSFMIDLSSSKKPSLNLEAEKIGEDVVVKQKISYKDL